MTLSLADILNGAHAPASAPQVSSTSGAELPQWPAPDVAFIPPVTPTGGPELFAPPAPGTGTEYITTRELAQLAGKLGRSKSDEKNEVGRALLRAIKGEVYAQHGQRDRMAYMLAAECVEAYPLLDPDTVVECFAASISRCQIEGSKMTIENFRGKLERVQAERQTRITMARTAAGSVGKVLAEQAALTVQTPTAFGVAPDVSNDTRANTLNSAGLSTLIVIADGDFYLRTPDSGTFDWRLTSALELSVQLTRSFGCDNSTVSTHNEKGQIAIPELCQTYARVAKHIVRDYSAPSITYDLPTESLQIGFPIMCPEPEPCELTHEWLYQLAGGTELDVEELYDWIAGTSRAHINHPAAALVIVGPKDIGKSLLPTLIAATWGLHPVKLANAVERFNGSLAGSPFWHADERMPEDMTDANFREIVQERTRLIEPKGREKSELRGCGRLMFSLNATADLRLGTIEGPDVVRAVADRIAFFSAANRYTEIVSRLEPLRIPGSHDVDTERMVRHLRWIQDTYQPKPQRFLGTRSDSAQVRAAILGQTSNDQAVDAVIEYLTDPLAWERTYRATKANYADEGNRFPLITRAGGLYVWGPELAARLRTDPGKCIRALSPFRLGRREISMVKHYHRAQYYQLDFESICEARGITKGSDMYDLVVQALCADTRDRIPKIAD